MKAWLKKVFYGVTGRYDHIRKSNKHKSNWYGNQYGGFYAIPELLNEYSIVYSMGIGEDISFDEAIIEQHGCKVFGFDPTPKSINWCRNTSLPQNFTFYDYGIANTTGRMRFYLPKIEHHVSGSIIDHNNVSHQFVEVNMMSLRDIMKSLDHEKIDLLKMDIEGSEYEVIDDILKTDIQISQLAIEFHERFFKNGKEKTIRAIQNLKEKGYEISAVSNSFQEVSFVKTGLYLPIR